MNNNEGDYILFGDFNVVRDESEKWGCNFSKLEADDFNTFINNASMTEVPMGGYSFTRLSSNGSKMSKLDRFFITEGIGMSLPNLTAIALKNVISDHRPILLSQIIVDFGPTSFKLQEQIKTSQSIIKGWWATVKKNRMDAKQTLYQTLKDLDMKIDQGVADQNDLAARSSARANLNILEAKEIKDLAQRSKIKWSIEGDENSKYFHGILNSKRRYLAIKGIKWEGEWVTDAQRVKDTFMEHFREKFSPVETITVCHRSHRFCNTPKMSRSGIRIRGVLLQDQQHKI
ncbi:RNA-directed DNA polymerase, eukaryota, partial [Tanacetum coccineum]